MSTRRVRNDILGQKLFALLDTVLRDVEELNDGADSAEAQRRQQLLEQYVGPESPLRDAENKSYREVIDMLRFMRQEAQESRPTPNNFWTTQNFERLCQQPKRYDLIEPPQRADRPVSLAALNYKITPRITQLALPKNRVSMPEKSMNPSKPSKSALKYKATPRIKRLAKPRKFSKR